MYVCVYICICMYVCFFFFSFRTGIFIYFYLAKSQMLHFEKQNLKQPNALPITEEGLATVQNILKLCFYTSRFKMSSVRTKKSTACSFIKEKKNLNFCFVNSKHSLMP